MDKTSPRNTPWQRAIILVDMNAFFASVEQYDYPKLRGRPLAVTNGERGTCIITSSYEARAFGVKTGMRIYDAKRLCPGLIQVPARSKRYVAVSQTIMKALNSITPDIEVFSIDEAFLDVTYCQALHGSPEKMARMAKEKVFEASGLLCSVGVSGDKTTAKYAAKLQKPNGLTVIPPWEAKQRLQSVPVTEICGIGRGIGAFLAKHGVHVCGEMEHLPIGVLTQRLGNLGRRIWYMCQGLDPDPIHTEVGDPKSMGHGKVMPPNTRDKQTIDTYLMHMSEKLATRLRRHGFTASKFFIGLKNRQLGWLGQVAKLSLATDDGKDIYHLGLKVFKEHWHGEPVYQIQVTAQDPHVRYLQLDLFDQPDEKREKLNLTKDAINERFGEFTIAPALLLERSDTPNVIAPAWKPDGHRQTI